MKKPMAMYTNKIGKGDKERQLVYPSSGTNIATSSRAIRRANGQHRVRTRLRGTIKWHPFKQKFMKNKFDREMVQRIKSADRKLDNEGKRVRADD